MEMDYKFNRIHVKHGIKHKSHEIGEITANNFQEVNIHT